MPGRKNNIEEDDNIHEDYFRRNRMWKKGPRKSWYYPAVDAPHIRLYWDMRGRPCMQYRDAEDTAISMVREGKKLEDYSLGVEKLEAERGEDFSLKVVLQAVVAMRNWPLSSPSR